MSRSRGIFDGFSMTDWDAGRNRTSRIAPEGWRSLRRSSQYGPGRSRSEGGIGEHRLPSTIQTISRRRPGVEEIKTRAQCDKQELRVMFSIQESFNCSRSFPEDSNMPLFKIDRHGRP